MAGVSHSTESHSASEVADACAPLMRTWRRSGAEGRVPVPISIAVQEIQIYQRSIFRSLVLSEVEGRPPGFRARAPRLRSGRAIWTRRQLAQPRRHGEAAGPAAPGHFAQGGTAQPSAGRKSETAQAHWSYPRHFLQ
jgi:hypothetical protein